MSYIFDHNNKDMPLDRYPYMDNNLKSKGRDISDLKKRVKDIENSISDISSKLENTISAFDDFRSVKHTVVENFENYITLDKTFRSNGGEIKELEIFETENFKLLKLSYLITNYEAYLNAWNDPNRDFQYKQYGVKIGSLVEDIKPYSGAYCFGGSNRSFGSLSTLTGGIFVRMYPHTYPPNSETDNVLSFLFIKRNAGVTDG